KHLGTISTYHNLFHNKYIYLKFNLSDYSVNIPFSKIVQAEHQALQVMIDSNENPIVDFLLRNGFICKRHCYTLTVNKKDLKIEINNKLSLHFFNTESPD
ncbi:acetyltransferase, partial [Lactobacillus crispatus]